MRVAVLLVIVLAACGPKTPPPAVVANVPSDAGPAPPLPEGCPAAFSQAGGECTANVSCTYPEGTCYCGYAYPCTGVALPDDYFAGQPMSWQCTAIPPAVRADGCPGSQPSGACGQEGQQCAYGSCCVSNYACQGGQWVAGMASCPP